MSFVVLWELNNHLEYIRACDSGMLVCGGKAGFYQFLFTKMGFFGVFFSIMPFSLFEISSPALENSLWQGTDDTGVNKNFKASLKRCRYACFWFCQYFKGSCVLGTGWAGLVPVCFLCSVSTRGVLATQRQASVAHRCLIIISFWRWIPVLFSQVASARELNSFSLTPLQ